MFEAILDGSLIGLEAGKLKQIKLEKVIDFELEVPSGQPTVYVAFTETKTVDFPISAGASRSFTPQSSEARYNRPVYVWAATAGQVRVIINRQGPPLT